MNMDSLDLIHEDDNVLDFDILNWSAPVEGRTFTLRLENMDHGGKEGKARSRGRNILRLKEAQGRRDIVNLSIHYICCIDPLQLEAILELVKHGDRDWASFSMTGINEVGNLYSPLAFSKELKVLFQGLKDMRILTLQSSPTNTGHGLELMLEEIPSFSNLEELRLHGWQIDRISGSTLVKSLECQTKKSIRLLSMKSCRFLGETTFDIFCRGLEGMKSLNTLDLSYSNLRDTEIIRLIESTKIHPSIECVDLERNCCQDQSSLHIIADWISEGNCNLRALNVGALWTGFSDDGLLVRFVDPMPLFSALCHNSSLSELNVSGSFLDNKDIQKLTESLSSRRRCRKLTSLNVGINPFDQNGAATLLRFVRDLRTVQHIKFENPFIKYECAKLIKIQAEANYFNAFVGKSVDIPLSVWPNIFARVQKGKKPRTSGHVSEFSADNIYRSLRAGSGSYGKQLCLRIATQNSKDHF